MEFKQFKSFKLKGLFLFLSIGILMLSVSSCESTVQKEEVSIIGKANIKLESDILTPEVLWSFGRLGDVQVSPDGNTLLYGVSYYSKELNKSNRELFTLPSTGGEPKQLTKTAGGEYGAVWSVDGKKIFYLAAAQNGNGLQIWSMNSDGSSKMQISNVSTGVSNIKVAPNGSKVLFTSDIKIDKNVQDMYPDLPLADAKLYDDIMYRHWDTWEDGYYGHIFVADILNGKIENTLDIMEGEPFESPLMPFGGIEEINWSPDSKTVAYTCKKLSGKEYSLSTNSDVYLYNLDTKETINFTDGMPGYDMQPLYSPDGTKLAWLSMARAGFEADKQRLFIADLATGEKKNYSENFDHSPFGMQWTEDSKSIYFVAGIFGTHQIHKFDFETGKIKAVTEGMHDYHSVSTAGDQLIGTKVSMIKPQEIYAINVETGNETELSFENKHILDQLTMPTVEKRYVKTTDGQKMLTWVILPPHFDATKKYPGILYCEGGPQSPLSQFWSYRWNFSIMASNDYVVVAPNRRGVLTMGQKWTDQISKDNSGQAMKDLLSAIDKVKEEPYVDEERLGAIGASFGGFSVYWLAGNHNNRFKTFIAHCGVFHSEMEYMTTEESFFDSWEKGGAPWEKNNKVAMKSYAGSPSNFVQNWDTPILVIHGGKDFRVPYSQGMAAFNSARLVGVKARFLYFPEENHWVLKPQNGILWQRTFFNWLDEHLKE
ncbi:MAG: prolyl oligopeptidase family serine peptidase [Bacteroidales bacterium]|nr:prolyl oligopeptidase family serine peptidase [Bacteroidales bacterium]